MGFGIWAIFYSLPETGSSDYLFWFHQVHIPQKLSRPGYTWASHFKSLCQDRSRSHYLALFGGETTRTFFDPSPKQLKQKQDEETRRMIGRRLDASSFIYTVEWQTGEAGGGLGDPIADPVLWLERYADPEESMDLETWCAQERTSLSGRIRNCRGSRKLLAASGTPRHAVTFEFPEADIQESGIPLLQEILGSGTPDGVRLHGSPFVGSRIWP